MTLDWNAHYLIMEMQKVGGNQKSVMNVTLDWNTHYLITEMQKVVGGNLYVTEI